MNNKITKDNADRLLMQLVDSLRDQNIQEEFHLLVTGGLLSVKFFNCREQTDDIDYIFPSTMPNNIKDILFTKIMEISKSISKKENLQTQWINNGAQVFVGNSNLETDILIFDYRGVRLFAANSYYSVLRKLLRFEQKDKIDLKAMITYLKDSKEDLFTKIKPFYDERDSGMDFGVTGETDVWLLLMRRYDELYNE